MYNSILQLSASSKHAYLRSSVMGIRQNNVVMAVLEPLDRGMKEDSCVINYRYFIALYSNELEQFLITEKKLSPHKAHLIMNFNTNNWKQAKELLHEFLDKESRIVEYNRQPTIRLQSSIPLTIVGLTTAKVIYVHPTTCKKPNADHDKSVTFMRITHRCNNTENCWNALKPISPAGPRKSEDKYIG